MTIRADIRPLPEQPPLFVLPTPKPERPVFKPKRIPPSNSLYGLAIRDLRMIGETLSKAGIGEPDDSIYVMVLKAARQLNKLRHELMAARLEVVTLKRQLQACQEETVKEGTEDGQ